MALYYQRVTDDMDFAQMCIRDRSLSTPISAPSTGFPSWSVTSTLTVLDLSSSPVSVPMISPAEPEASGTVI